jgi:hypothetical protein
MCIDLFRQEADRSVRVTMVVIVFAAGGPAATRSARTTCTRPGAVVHAAGVARHQAAAERVAAPVPEPAWGDLPEATAFGLEAESTAHRRPAPPAAPEPRAGPVAPWSRTGRFPTPWVHHTMSTVGKAWPGWRSGGRTDDR